MLLNRSPLTIYFTFQTSNQQTITQMMKGQEARQKEKKMLTRNFATMSTMP